MNCSTQTSKQALSNKSVPLCSKDIERVFNGCFLDTHQTRLVGGVDEPLYQPSNHTEPHIIYYRDDYVASALHEVAHWCIAGSERRKQIDYGYWYAPDGRDPQLQSAFEEAEIKPQAIEWAFSIACNKPFRVSIDNLHGDGGNERIFTANVQQQLNHYTKTSFPARAQQFIEALGRYYKTDINAVKVLSRKELTATGITSI